MCFSTASSSEQSLRQMAAFGCSFCLYSKHAHLHPNPCPPKKLRVTETPMLPFRDALLGAGIALAIVMVMG